MRAMSNPDLNQKPLSFAHILFTFMAVSEDLV